MGWWDKQQCCRCSALQTDCIVCPPGEYQHQTQQTACIDCPAGTVRYSDNVDGTSWNGATNNDIADTKADCKVCPSGRYQNEAGTTDCKHCPAGTMRAADSANDNKFWDGQTSSSNMLVADEKADCKDCALAANTNTKPNKLPALIVLLVPLERLMTMMMTHGMVGQIKYPMLQCKADCIVVPIWNTNTKLNKLCI